MDSKTIIESDALEIINESTEVINQIIKQEGEMTDITKEIQSQLFAYYDINDEDTILNQSKKY